MRRFVLFALLGAALAVLAVPQDARAWGWGRCGGMYAPGPYYPAPAYFYPPPVYYGPAYYPAPTYLRPAPRVVDVGAYDKVGFKPKTITVAPGTTVRWVNYGKERHTVTSRDGLFDSGELAPGATYSVTFTRPGTYHYFCRPHEKMGMVGTVVVGSGGGGGAGGGYGGGGSSGY